MLDEDAQREAFDRVVEASAELGLVVAPVGSVYFLFVGEPSLRTKDLDAVVHTKDLEPASIQQLEELGNLLGDVERSHDSASVVVTVRDADVPYEIDLLRGKRGGSAGFLNRDLLREAAKRGTKEKNVILYPPEFVITLKAEAAIDREQRAQKSGQYQKKNLERAEIFRQDVITKVRRLTERGRLSEEPFKIAIGYVKKSRQDAVANLIEAASGGQLRIAGSAKPQHGRDR